MHNRAITVIAAVLVAGCIQQVAAAPQETEIPGVTAELTEARQYDGALHIGITLHNSTNKSVSVPDGLRYADVVLIDKAANLKHYPIKDAAGHVLAGPIADWNEGGRWFMQLEPGSQTVMWILFEPVAPGSKLAVQCPHLQPLENVAVTEGPPAGDAQVGSDASGVHGSVMEATRSEGQLKLKLKIVNQGNSRAKGAGIRYSDVYALDAQGKRAYPLLKGSDGLFIAEPRSDKNEGGRWFLSGVNPEQQVFMSLTFQAPPDNVKNVDVIVPRFAPFENVAISGEGGAQASGIAVAGKSVELERVLKDLNADVTQQEIKVNLAADLLFDFDKADIKPAAEPQLDKVVTILKAYPDAHVTIDGHTDGKGSDAYNQSLSERRAQTVAQWLSGRSGSGAANFETHGFGKSKPIAPNTKPDGNDDPEGRAKNRRVEIVVKRAQSASAATTPERNSAAPPASATVAQSPSPSPTKAPTDPFTGAESTPGP